RSDRQHKKAEFTHSKAVGLGICLVPHTCRFLARQALGVEPAVKSMLFTFVPTRPFREGGTLRSTWKGSGHTTAFLRLDEIPRAVCLWTKGSRLHGRSFWGQPAVSEVGHNTLAL